MSNTPTAVEVVKEALEEYAECRHINGHHTYNAVTNDARNAVLDLIEAQQAEIARLRVEAARSERRARMFSGLMHNHILAMQAAVIDATLTGDPAIGLQWIKNTLFGPGHYPDVEIAKAMGGAQAYFDIETAKEEKRLAALDAANTTPEKK